VECEWFATSATEKSDVAKDHKSEEKETTTASAPATAAAGATIINSGFDSREPTRGKTL